MNRHKPIPRSRNPLAVVMDGLLLLGLLWGCVLCFCTAFTLDVDYRTLTLGIFLLALAALMIFSLRLRFGMPVLLVFSFAWGRAVWLLWDTLFAGQASIQCAVVNSYANAFPFIQKIAPISELTAPEWTWAVTLTVVAAAAPLAILLGCLVVRVRIIWPTLLFTGLFLLPGLCVTLTPHHVPLLVLLGCWCVLLLTALVPPENQRGAVVLSVIALPSVALLLTLLTLVLPLQNYQQPKWAISGRESLIDSITNLTIKLGTSGRLPGPFGAGNFTAAGSTATVDLASAGAQVYDGHTVLRITTDYIGKLYLRGHSAALYEDNLWHPLPDSAYEGLLEAGALSGTDLNPLNLPAQTRTGAPYFAFEVDNVSAPGGCVYTPYQLLTKPSELRGAAYLDDSSLARDRFVSKHTVYFRPAALDLEQVENVQASTAEQRYREFVYAYYLQLPDGFRQALNSHGNALWPELRRMVVGSDQTSVPMSVLAARAIANYLSELAVYDLNTPAVPNGEDFTLYFLNESHQGYCMHFASAAALLLRELGIPARYVSGYVTRTVVPGRVDVADRSAHAWVEVYVDGYGWYPVEVTPGYQGSALPWVEGSETPTAVPTARPSATPKPSHTPRPSTMPSPTPSLRPEATAGALPFDARLLILPVLLLTLAFISLLVRGFTRYLRHRHLYQKDPGRCAVACYRYALRLSHHGGIIPLLVEETAQKAIFSQGGISFEEAHASRQALSDEVTRLTSSLSRSRRWLLRWFWFVL